MISLLRTAFTMLVAAVLTLVLGSITIVGAQFGMRDREGGLFDRVPRIWSRAVLWASGVRVRVHGLHIPASIGGPCIFAANHVSLFDVPVLAATLPRYKFIAKIELFSVPLFGAGIRALGMVPIQRSNQKAAFDAYRVAVERIHEGSSVVVFPEGTRGTSYDIRPFKKGPIILAISAGVPIVPCIVRGTAEVLPKHALRLRPGPVSVHLLEPVHTAGCSYDDRNAIAAEVTERMQRAMNSLARGEDLSTSSTT